MYCPNCGKAAEEGDRFCRFCSFRFEEFHDEGPQGPDDQWIDDSVRNATTLQTKSTGLAMFLSIILPGIGANYIDSESKGLGVFFVSLILWVVGFLVIQLMLVVPFINFALWIYGIVLTSHAIDDYKASLR